MNQKAKKYLSLLLVMLCTFSFWGFKYFPILDDNNQYGVYNLRNDDTWTNVITHYKNYTVRPLALFTDSYVLSYLWHNMYLAVVLMVVLHWMTTCFLKEIFEKININVSWIWFALFGFAPFLTEAIYWVSASSRIVVSMFFCVLSNLVLIRVLTDEKNKHKKVFFLIVAILLNIIANGYYEQTIVFNFALTLFVLIRLKKYKHIYIPFVSLFTGKSDYSILAGALTMTIVLLPVVIKTTSEALISIPSHYMSSSLALGATKSQTIFKIILPASLPGILTSALLCIGRIIGESAALIFVMGSSIKDNINIFQGATSLSLHIWSITRADKPNYEAACAISIIILLVVFLLNVIVKIISYKINKKRGA